MRVPTEVSKKIRNGLNYVNARPHIFIPPQMKSILEKAASGVDVLADEAALVVEWFESDKNVPENIRNQLIGKDAGLKWWRALGKRGSTLKIKNEDKTENPPVVQRRIIHEAAGVNGQDAWTPTFATFEDSGSIFIFVDWIDGEGAKPESGYLGPNGLVSDIADATAFPSESAAAGQELFIQVGGTATVPAGADESKPFKLFHQVDTLGGGPLFDEYLWIPD